MKQVKIRELKDFFEYKQITGNEESLERWVIIPDINRPGLELSGYWKQTEPRRIVIIGEKETEYIKTLDEKTQRERFEKFTDGYTPCIIITHGQECPVILKEIAAYKNFPILSTEELTYQATVDIISFLDRRLAAAETFYGELVSIYGMGVLITGESGMGKSELALDLIKKGHCLVADDCVEISKVHNSLIGTAPELLKNMLEIRGIGIVDVARMYGINAILDHCKIDMVIDLQKYDEDAYYDRIGSSDRKTFEYMGVTLPKYEIPIKEGRNMSVLVESAVNEQLLRKVGFNSGKYFEEKSLKIIEKNRIKNS